jgi:hypothetical protein
MDLAHIRERRSHSRHSRELRCRNRYAANRRASQAGTPSRPVALERHSSTEDWCAMSATPAHEPRRTDSLRERYSAAPDFKAMLGSAQKNAELWAAVWRRAEVGEDYQNRVAALEGVWHLLVLSEDWCGDAVNTVPVIAKLAELSTNTDLRVLARDENLDLMDAHLTGTARSIPVVIALDANYRECGWWSPRPTELQEWVMGSGQSLEKAERYREIRRWYARDRGRTTLEEVVSMLERAARA